MGLAGRWPGWVGPCRAASGGICLWPGGGRFLHDWQCKIADGGSWRRSPCAVCESAGRRQEAARRDGAGRCVDTGAGISGGCYRLFISVTSIADAVRCHTVARLWTARPDKARWYGKERSWCFTPCFNPYRHYPRGAVDDSAAGLSRRPAIGFVAGRLAPSAGCWPHPSPRPGVVFPGHSQTGSAWECCGC